MATELDGGPGTQGPEVGNLPGAYVGTMRRHRRRHDRNKYPWRTQRRRRKLIQVTVASSIALLFLCGVLYVMLSSRAHPSSSDADSMNVLVASPSHV